MQRFISILMVFALAAFASAADLSKFTGPTYKTAKVKSLTQVYASVDPRTSEVGALILWARPGQVFEVLGVYSPYVNVQAKNSGWAWVELLTVTGDSAVCDRESIGRDGVALLAQPNEPAVVNGPLYPGETAKIIGYWPRWVKLKLPSGPGLIFATEVELSQ
jgi:hypothetical protein